MSAYIGSRVRLLCEFRDFDLTLADPEVVTLVVDGVLVVPLRDSAGMYHYDYTATSPGRKIYRWEGDGTIQAATENAIVINDHLR